MIPTDHPSPQPKRHLDRFSCVCIDDRRVSLYFTMRRPFAAQYYLFPFGIWTPSGRPTWFLGPTRVLNPNGISICAAIFAGLTSVTRQTDRQTTPLGRSVTTGRIYVRNTAMRLKKYPCSKILLISYSFNVQSVR